MYSLFLPHNAMHKCDTSHQLVLVHLSHSYLSPSLPILSAICLGGPGLAGTRNVSILDFMAAKDGGGGETTGAKICAKLQSNSHQPGALALEFLKSN